jgi:hypothetical protein
MAIRVAELADEHEIISLSGLRIWTNLLPKRIHIIREAGSNPVTETWSTNEHVKRTLLSHGGNAGQQVISSGVVNLLVT